MLEPTCFTNHFLIAMPALADPNFFKTVTYICEHNANGALGIVINRPLELSLADLYSNLGLDAPLGSAERPIYQGGPVHPEQGFVLHRPSGSWLSTLTITAEIGVTTSRDILEAIARGEGPRDALVALGYAGWGPGQLEREMGENAWLAAPVDPEIIFNLAAERRWDAAAKLLGVDLALLSPDAGHA